METTAVAKECQACQKIQNIVITNEQMIQEQVKMIKQLHTDNSVLTNRNEEL